LIIRSINLVVGRVAFPVLAKLQMEREHLQYIYLNYLSYISMVVIPAGVGLTLVTSPLVLIVYTDKWFDSIQPMQWISLGIAISALGHIPGVLYKAIDRPDILNKLSMIKLPITVAVLWVSTRWGIVGVAVGQLIMGVIKVLMDLGVAQYTIGISTRHTIKSIAPAFAGSLVMAAVLIPLALFIKLPDSILLVIMVVVGGGVYIGSMMMFNRKLLVDAWSVVKSALPNAGQR
jgi:O-antigen/teichoic acid export membrane protein